MPKSEMKSFALATFVPDTSTEQRAKRRRRGMGSMVTRERERGERRGGERAR